MRKKTMQYLFVILFLAGLIVGFMIPGDLGEMVERTQNPLIGGVFDINKRMGQLDLPFDFGKSAKLGQIEDDAAIQLIRIEKDIPMHIHPKETHVLYIYKGNAKVNLDGRDLDAKQGQMVIIPAGMPHSVSRIGNVPIEVIVFSSPPADVNDIKVLEK